MRHGSLDNLAGSSSGSRLMDPGPLLHHQSMLNLPVAAPPFSSGKQQVDVEIPIENIDTGTVTGTDISLDSTVPMDISAETRADLGITFHQCSAARRSATKVEAVSINQDETFGRVILTEPERVGSLNPPGDGLVVRTFHGARAARGDRPMNQSVSVSFDPASLTCITCSNEHKIVGNEPMVLLLSDQNFIPYWPGNTTSTCTAIIRVENGTLHELCDLLFEIFENTNLPEGTVVLVGAAAYLHMVGSSTYCREWTQVLCRIGRRWAHVRIGPLIPIFREDCPGGVTRELVEVGYWFSKVYSGVITGLKICWDTLLNVVFKQSAGATLLQNAESYTIPLPSGLDPVSNMAPCTFCTKSSRPSLLKGFDQGVQRELLTSISVALERDFHISTSMEGILENAQQTAGGGQEKVTHIILVGASNLRRVVPHLIALGYKVTDLCVPGWHATPENVAKLVQGVHAVGSVPGTILVFDVFGNSCTRYIECDGSVSRPYKGENRYHLAGDVVVCSDPIFGKIIEIVLPLLQVLPGHKRIILPPQPRYLFSKCCNSSDHCTNVGKESHSEALLAETIKLRAHLKKALTGALSKNFWLADSCCSVPSAGSMPTSGRLAALKKVTLDDGVHCTFEGYRNYATNIVAYMSELENARPASAALSITGSCKRFTWHGFASCRGSSNHRQSYGPTRLQKERIYKQTAPYMRGGRGGGAKRGK